MGETRLSRALRPECINIKSTKTLMRKHLFLLMLSFFAMVATEALAQLKETVTVTSVGYATFSSDMDLDFTNAVKIKAYTAKISGNYVNFSRIYQVPRYTGVLLWASGGATEEIPSIASANPVDNDFRVAQYDMNRSDLDDGGKAYVLGNHQDYGIGFYRPSENFVLPQGKCYLQIWGDDARIFIMPGMETTGISATLMNSGATKSGIYNLNGQRIGKLQKGLNIVGGKKVIVK